MPLIKWDIEVTGNDRRKAESYSGTFVLQRTISARLIRLRLRERPTTGGHSSAWVCRTFDRRSECRRFPHLLDTLLGEGFF
jgi:hypothetical protein